MNNRLICYISLHGVIKMIIKEVRIGDETSGNPGLLLRGLLRDVLGL